jgi:hypothetical protein
VMDWLTTTTRPGGSSILRSPFRAHTADARRARRRGAAGRSTRRWHSAIFWRWRSGWRSSRCTAITSTR